VEFATKSDAPKTGADRKVLNPAANTIPIKIDPASDPANSPAAPLSVKYALVQPVA
jgi:hypothetical protein